MEAVFYEVEDYAIIMLNTKGEILSWNTGAEKIKGYTAKEIIGKNYRIFYTSEDKDVGLSDNLLKEAKKEGRTSIEGWRVRKDGTRFWGSMTLTALHNADGSAKGYLNITRDLTEKKIAEDTHSNFVEKLKIKNVELKKSEERYHKMVLEVVDYAIILLDKDGTILDWNKGAEKLKGYTAKEIIGKASGYSIRLKARRKICLRKQPGRAVCCMKAGESGKMASGFGAASPLPPCTLRKGK